VFSSDSLCCHCPVRRRGASAVSDGNFGWHGPGWIRRQHRGCGNRRPQRGNRRNPQRPVAARREFTVPNLPPRKYEVTIAKTGFRTLRETSLELKVDQGARLDAGFNDENPRDSGAQARPPLALRLVGIQNAAGHDTQLRPAPHLPIAFPTGGPPASRPYSAE
jgi:hypothetical protein